MTQQAQGNVDLRAFHWPLLPLERKLHWERDAARADLARCLRAAEVAQLRVGALERERGDQAASALACMRHALDPRVHRETLRYLAMMDAHLRDATHRLGELQQASAAARRECLARECKLETLAAARASAMRVYLRRASLRQHKEADIAWLMHEQSVRAGNGSVL